MEEDKGDFDGVHKVAKQRSRGLIVFIVYCKISQ